MEGFSHLIENVTGTVEQLILMESNLDMEVWLEKWKERYVDKVRQALPDRNPLWLDKEKSMEDSDESDEDDAENDEDDHDDDSDDDIEDEVRRDVVLSNKRKVHTSTVESGPSKKKQKTTVAATQANEDGYFWNEGAELWTDGNMKFFKRVAIPSVNPEEHVRYQYIEQSLGLNHEEELEVNATVQGATEFGENALVHPDVRSDIFSIGLGLDSLDG